MDKCNFCSKSNENNVCVLQNHDDRVPYCTEALDKMINSAKGGAIYHSLCQKDKEILGVRGFHKCSLCAQQFNGYCTLPLESERDNNCTEAIYNLMGVCGQLENIRL